MSLYKARKSLCPAKLQIGAEFINIALGRQSIFIGGSDEKTIRHKFSRFDMECNCFNFPGNTFTGEIRVFGITPNYSRTRSFDGNNIVRAYAKLGSN